MADPLSYFGITPPGNPLSAFFPQQGGDDAFRSQLEERPINRAQIPPEYLVASQLPDPMGFLQQVQQQRGQTEARQAIQGLQNLDFGSKDYPASVAKLLSKYPNAAQNSAVQNILKLKEFSGKQAADTKYNTQAAQAVKQFLAIPEDDPNYDQKFQDFIGGLDADVLQHPRLASLIERGVHNSSSIRSKKTADQQVTQAVDRQLTKAGLKPSDFSSLDDKQDALAEAMQQSAQQEKLQKHFQTFRDDAKEFSAAMRGLRKPIPGPEYDQAKADRMGKKINQMTPADWITADSLLRQDALARVEDIAGNIRMQTGVNPLRALSGAPEPRSAPTTPGQPQNAPAGVSEALVGPPESTVQPEPLVGPPAPPQGLERVQQVIQQPIQEEAQKTSQLESARRALSPEWTKAKNQVYSLLPPTIIDEIKQGVPISTIPIANRIGKNPQEVVTMSNGQPFIKEDGLPVTWQDVITEAVRDPSFQEVVSGKARPSPFPVVNSKVEYDALPSGSVYVDSHGKQARKK